MRRDDAAPNTIACATPFVNNPTLRSRIVLPMLREAAFHGGERSRGGVKFPTGGNRAKARQPASACSLWEQGQQTRCDSGADGIVRMVENG